MMARAMIFISYMYISCSYPNAVMSAAGARFPTRFNACFMHPDAFFNRNNEARAAADK